MSTVFGARSNTNRSSNPITAIEDGEYNRLHTNSSLNVGGSEVSLNNPVPIGFSNTAMIDAFGRMRISNPETIFDSKQIFDNQPLFWDDAAVLGAGTTSTWTGSTASTTIGVSDSTVGKRIRQTKMRFNYQPGKSQLIFLTGVIGNQPTDVAARIGYFDDDNGIFFVNTAGIAAVGIRSSTSGTVVDDLVTQSNWNMDTMDGNGPSGINLDFDKAQIFLIDFEWLGVGRVRAGFVIDGLIYYCHEFLHTNILSDVYMSTPNLPLRYEIQNGGTGAASTLKHICSSVMSEGGTQNLGILRHADSQLLPNLGSNVEYGFLGIRLRDTHLGANINLENVSIIGTTANDFAHWELTLNPTVAGSVLWSDFPNSAVQISTGSLAYTITDGTELDGGFFAGTLPTSASANNALRLGADINGSRDEIWLLVRPITNNMDATASMTWRELS